MKKLTVILIVVLLGIFLLNAMQLQITAEIYPEQTMGLISGRLNENIQKMSSGELDLLYMRCGASDIDDATRLIGLWGALLRVMTESEKIIQER
jgi:hypothetical protein